MEGRRSSELDPVGRKPDAAETEPDAVFVRRVVAGSQTALAELYDRHAAAILGASFRLLGERQQAEEVVQETFLTLWNRAEEFNPQLGSLRAWLMTIGRNRTIDRLRASGRQLRVVHFGALEAAAGSRDLRTDGLDRQRLVADDEASDPERQAELATVRAAVREVLADLPPLERQALVLAYFEGLTQQEIAERLAWPIGTVKTRTRRALRRMRTLLGPLVEPIGPAPLAGSPLATGSSVTAAPPGESDGSR